MHRHRGGLLGGSGGASPYGLVASPFPPGHFVVHKVRGREALYAFDVTVSTSSMLDGAIDLVLGQRATLSIHQGEAPTRPIHGIVARIGTVARHDSHGVGQYRLRVVPRMWLAKQQKRSRIFQHLRVDEVVEEVLREHLVPTRWRLQHEYLSREYCTQYEETDYEFIRRLLAESGIYFYFDQGSSLLGDALEGAAPDAPVVPIRLMTAEGETSARSRPVAHDSCPDRCNKSRDFINRKLKIHRVPPHSAGGQGFETASDGRGADGQIPALTRVSGLPCGALAILNLPHFR